VFTTIEQHLVIRTMGNLNAADTKALRGHWRYHRVTRTEGLVAGLETRPRTACLCLTL
jgi:hypothetical protein